MLKFSLGSFGAFPIFGWPYISKTSGRRAECTKILGLRGRSLVPTEYLSLLSVHCQFGVIPCISYFWRPCFFFSLKYSGIFVRLSLYVAGILLTSKWPSRVSKPLGLLFSKSNQYIPVSREGFHQNEVDRWNAFWDILLTHRHTQGHRNKALAGFKKQFVLAGGV